MSAVWHVPQYMDPSYLGFVHGIGGRRAKNFYPTIGKALECSSLEEVANVIPVNPGESLQEAICCSLHPGEGHFQHLWSLLKSSFQGSIGIYFPLYFLPMLVFKSSSLLRNPLTSVLGRTFPPSSILTLPRSCIIYCSIFLVSECVYNVLFWSNLCWKQFSTSHWNWQTSIPIAGVCRLGIDCRAIWS